MTHLRGRGWVCEGCCFVVPLLKLQSGQDLRDQVDIWRNYSRRPVHTMRRGSRCHGAQRKTGDLVERCCQEGEWRGNEISENRVYVDTLRDLGRCWRRLKRGVVSPKFCFKWFFVVSVKEMDFIGKESGRDGDEKGCYCNYPIEIGW